MGIIPARAGFTSRCARWLCRRTDHPRSRGVYALPTRYVTCRGGSSPLARGLRFQLADPQPPGGIIPARAGFTTCASRRTRRGADHPRSRGVYSTRTMTLYAYSGSSPLARGLPKGTHSRSSPDRIIPARAGFTSLDRSNAATLLGSSPLARGLRIQPADPQPPRGIIPARAGFTQ